MSIIAVATYDRDGRLLVPDHNEIAHSHPTKNGPIERTPGFYYSRMIHARDQFSLDDAYDELMDTLDRIPGCQVLHYSVGDDGMRPGGKIAFIAYVVEDLS